jgi:lysyl-tRNA synthetase class II
MRIGIYVEVILFVGIFYQLYIPKKKEKKTYMKQAFTGVPGKTNHGQLSIFVTNEMKILSPCLHDIPRTGLKDPVSLRKIYSLRF